MKNTEYTIRPINPSEIDQVADMISTGYYDDEFFIWSVPSNTDRHKIVADYYRIYLRAEGCVANIAQRPDGTIIGATVWLPHDVDSGMYDEIDKVVGKYQPQFRAVADKSHLNEPPMTPFYQLVGFVVPKQLQGQGLGAAMLKYQLDILDAADIPTYLEASTAYFGGGVYGRFGYQQAGELMVFADNAVLYPLWRPAGGVPGSDAIKRSLVQKQQNPKLHFGGFNWRVLDIKDIESNPSTPDESPHNTESNNASMPGKKLLLLAENVISLQKYHNIFEPVTWANSSARKYLNTRFYANFTPQEQARILETHLLSHPNPWYSVDGGAGTADKIFLLSVEEVVKYFGDSRQLTNPQNRFFIDDGFNDMRRAYLGSLPSRWVLRTPGSLSNFVTTVTNEGKIAITGDFVNRPSTELFTVGLRPAMWVKAIT